MYHLGPILCTEKSCILLMTVCKTNVSIPYVQVEKSKAFKCGTYGASSLRDRYLATGDFEGKLNIW